HGFRDVLAAWQADGPDLRDLLGERAAVVGPMLAPLLGEPAGAPGAAPAAAGREPTFAALEELLRALAARDPLAVVIDDLHWADPTTAALATHLLDLPARAPVLLVLATRPEADHVSAGVLRAARARPYTRPIELTGLAPRAERELLGHLVGTVPDDLS